MNPVIKRYALVLAFLVICVPPGLSQIRVGARAGIYSTRINADDFKSGGTMIRFRDKSKTGYHLGVVSQFQSGHIFLQPELLFCYIRNDIYIDRPSGEELTELEMNRIDLPLMVGYKLGTLKLQAGPVASVLINDKSGLTSLTGFDLLLRRATIGFQAGFGFDISKLSFDFKYEGNLSRLGGGIEVGGTEFEFDSRARHLIFSIGLFF